MIADEETKQAFEGITGQLTALMAMMNDQHERLLEQITALRGDFQNSKSFLVEDSLVTGRRVMSVEDRLAAIEKRLGL